MEKSESIKNIATALVKFNGLVGKVSKDSSNPFFKSKYAALPDILSAIHAPLQEAGLTLNQFPSGTHGLTTILIHADSGEYMMDTYEMKPTKDDPQGIGSCITYQRRYAVGAVLSLNIDEDDDGNAASAPKITAKKPEPVVRPELLPGTAKWGKCVEGLATKITTLANIMEKNTISEVNQALLLKEGKIMEEELAQKAKL